MGPSMRWLSWPSQCKLANKLGEFSSISVPPAMAGLTPGLREWETTVSPAACELESGLTAQSLALGQVLQKGLDQGDHLIFVLIGSDLQPSCIVAGQHLRHSYTLSIAA